MKDRGLCENIKNIYRKITHAAMRTERNPEDVKLIAVTKTVDTEKIKEAIDWGLRNFGESRVQEAKSKIEELSRLTPHTLRFTPITWHLIGHLQTNKCRDAVHFFEMIQSVDSLHLAEELNRRAEQAAKRLPILLEVNVAGEARKFGYRPESLLAELGKSNDFWRR